MNKLINPKSIAIIGASKNPSKIGHSILKNLINYGYKGKIYPINPKYEEIKGLKCYKSVLDVPEDIDCAVIVVPNEVAIKVLEECGQKKIKFVVMITSGFKEIGRCDLEEKLISICKKYNIKLLGPNCFGFVNTKNNINCTFGQTYIKKGSISIITQSGGIGISMIGWANRENIGLEYVISLGNKSILNETDFLDLDSKCLVFYLEDFKDGEKFLKKKPNKPIIVLKGGKSERGKQAALSHTGAMSGDYKVEKNILEQYGIYVADTLLECLDVSRACAELPMPKIPKLLIITNGGGLGVNFTDLCQEFPFLDDKEILSEFKDAIPEFGSIKNPIDVTGNAYLENYKKALDIAEKYKPIVALLYCETSVLDPCELAKLISNYKNLPLVVGMVGGEKVKDAVEWLKREGIHANDNLLRAYYGIKGLFYKSKFMSK